jgi:predicted AAA+ superfamily ATPase
MKHKILQKELCRILLVAIVLGIRQVGKTTLIENLLSDLD